MKKILLLLIILLVILLIPIVGFFAVKSYYEKSITTPNPGSSSQVIVEIELGSSIKDIGKQLKTEGLIEDERVFEYYIRLYGLEDEILAGTYETKGNKTIPEIVEDLQFPISREVKVTIPEGLRFTQIAERLDKVLKVSPNWSKEEFLELVANPSSNFNEFTILESKP